MQGTPKGIFPYVTEFCSSLTSLNEPFFIKPNPDAGSVTGWCTEIVAERVKRCGGKPILGWRIWEWYGIMIESEFHMIWESPEGELVDITPAPQDNALTLFLPDNSLTYEGKQIDNIRLSLIKDPRVTEFIQVNKEIFKIMNTGNRSLQHGYVTLTKKEANERTALERRKAQLGILLQNTLPERNELCRCGSGVKSKKCCFK